MENKQMKCIKGKSCLYCGSTYCRFVDELDELKAEKDNYKQVLQEIKGIVFELKKIVKSYKFDKYTSQILQKCEVIRVENENEPKR